MAQNGKMTRASQKSESVEILRLRPLIITLLLMVLGFLTSHCLAGKELAAQDNVRREIPISFDSIEASVKDFDRLFENTQKTLAYSSAEGEESSRDASKRQSAAKRIAKYVKLLVNPPKDLSVHLKWEKKIEKDVLLLQEELNHHEISFPAEKRIPFHDALLTQKVRNQQNSRFVEIFKPLLTKPKVRGKNGSEISKEMLQRRIDNLKSLIENYRQKTSNEKEMKQLHKWYSELEQKEKVLSNHKETASYLAKTDIPNAILDPAKLNEYRASLQELEKRNKQNAEKIAALLKAFLEQNGKYRITEMIGGRFSIVANIRLGENPGTSALLAGGLFTGGDWTNTAVKSFSKVSLKGERLVILRVHALPSLADGRSASYNILSTFNPAHFPKGSPEVELIKRLSGWIEKSALTLVIGNEVEGGSSVYYGSEGPLQKTQTAVDLIQKDPKFLATLTPKCENVSLLRSHNAHSLVSQTDRKYPDNLFYELSVCDRLMKQSRIQQAVAMINDFFLTFDVIDKPLNHPFASAALVNIKDLNKDIIVDMKYAKPDNFLGKPLYGKNECYLQKEVAMKLVLAQKYLEKRGLGLKCLDCYRPLSVQKKMWKIMPDARYVANPKKGSRHNRGISVDVTLVDAQGDELEMPTKFDDFSKRAWANYPNLPQWQKENRELLRGVMERSGFKGIRTEWWHFDGASAKDYPLISSPLAELD